MSVPLHCIFLCLLVAMSQAACKQKRPVESQVKTGGSEIQFSGVGLLGIFDPSVAYDAKNKKLWMSYSYVEPSKYWKSDKHFGVGLRLAYSTNGGRNWQDAGIVVSPFVDHQVGPLPSVNPKLNLPRNSRGTWQSETSSLLYDPYAPADQRWKIIWHQYLKANGTSYFVDYAWISLKTAASPGQLARARPIKLFGGKFIQATGEQGEAPAFSPTPGAPKIALNREITRSIDGADSNELNNCVWAEPSLLADGQGVHLAINCQYLAGSDIQAYVVMFSCARPCNMQRADNWVYKGRVLTPAHAQQIGFRNYSAPDLSKRGDNYYLTVTPVRDVKESAYEGCRVYRFADFSKARLAMNQGKLTEVQRYDGIHHVHNGACAANGNMNVGLLHSQIRPDDPPRVFRILKTQNMIR